MQDERESRSTRRRRETPQRDRSSSTKGRTRRSRSRSRRHAETRVASGHRSHRHDETHEAREYQSRSRSRQHAETRGASEHRSRRHAESREASEYQSRSRSRRHAETRVASGHRSHRHDETREASGYRSRSPLYSLDQDHQDNSLWEREKELERERERLRVREDWLARDQEEYRRRREASRVRSSTAAVAHVSLPQRLSEGGEVYQPHHPSTSGENVPVMKVSSPTFSTQEVFDLLKNLKPQTSAAAPVYPNNNTVHKNILSDFDPSTKIQRIDIWLKKVNECATVYGWDNKTTIHFAMQKLQGLAKIWYESLNTILYTWPEWQDKLLAAFPSEQNYGQLLEDMLKRKSRFNEPIEVYYYEKLSLLNQCDIEGKRAVDCIIHGLSDKTMRYGALALCCLHPDQLLQFLMSNQERPHYYPNRPNFKNRYDTNGNNSGNRTIVAAGNRMAVSQSSSLFCFNCKEKGHPYLKCSKPLMKCSRCSRIGHKVENCTQRLDNGEINKADLVHKTMCITSSNNNSKYIKEATINNVVLKAFVDFGSEVSLMSSSVLPMLGLTCEGETSVMRGFGNDLVHSLGSVGVELSIDGVQAKVKFLVVDEILLESPLLVGQTYTEQRHIVVYKTAESLQFYDVCNELPFTESGVDDGDSVKVVATSFTVIGGPATIRAITEPSIDGNIFISDKIIGEPSQQCRTWGGVYEVKNGFVNICIAPLLNSCQLHEGAVLCRAVRVQIVNRIFSSNTDINPSTISELDDKMISIGDSVSSHHKDLLVKLLNKFKHCFASNLKELGCTDATEMHIELNSKRPVVYRPYRLSHKEREHVRGMIDEMLEAGIIRESVSEYASPIILVRKKDGKLRMCVDYRLLNSVTVKERYPMPIIEDEISRLSGQAYFVVLDLASGYYQVPISEDSKALTSFVTPDGQFEFNRMPFGLANAPAVFQRMMNKVLGSTRFTEATAYIDDVLIYGRDAEECLNRLENVLKLLEDAKLTLNLSKCEFLRDNINYLGYEISGKGVRPGDKKVQCVIDFPRPTNQHTVRQFLGLVGYFRKFIQNFAQIAHPLSKLLKKDVNWCWLEEQEQSFIDLKKRLVNRPILAIYDPTAETELHTDASKIGIGGILLQRPQNSDTFRPVAFYSRQTSPEERNFHAYELETLAVVCSLRKFRVYLMGQKFKIVTDCSALRSTFSKRDLIPRIARWWLLLQEFQCSVEYRPGPKMAHVDALSRNPIVDDKVDECVDVIDQYPTVMTITDEDWLQTLQLGDSELCRIRDVLSTNLDSDGLQYIKDNYVLKDNRLYKCINGDKTNIRWVVPKGARWQLCRMNHDDIGHLGEEKTMERIKKSYWFPKMSKFIKKYVNGCMECAYAKKTSTANEGELHTIKKIEIPFNTVHIDHLGPFVRSKRGNSYLLIIVDAFTKFIFVKPVRNTKTETALRVLEDVFFTFRNPDRIVSDRGTCFTSHTFKRFCVNKGIRHVLNAVASPRSNGQVERYNRTILSSLIAQNLNHNEREWDDKVGQIQWGLNNTRQKTTGRTPAEVLFGTSMNAEIDPRLNEIRQETREDNDIITIREEVKDRIEEEQEKQKKNYDKGRRPARVYGEGELVKITRTNFKNDGKSKKLLPSYIGPYRVVAVLGNDRYRLASVPGLSSSKNKRKTTVAADRMLPWVHVAALEVNNDSDEESDNSNC